MEENYLHLFTSHSTAKFDVVNSCTNFLVFLYEHMSIDGEISVFAMKTKTLLSHGM